MALAAARRYLALALVTGANAEGASLLARGNATTATAAGTSSQPSWWSSLFGKGGGGGSGDDRATNRATNRTAPAHSDKWRAGEPYARAHASRDSILEEIAANRARARQKLDLQRRWMLGTGGAAEWRGLVARFERACPEALRQTKHQSHDLRHHYNKAEAFHEPHGAAPGQEPDKGSWSDHVDYHDLADDDRVMLWQPEPATGLGNSLQV